MKKSIVISLALSSLLFGSSVDIIENDKQKNTYNEIDDKYKVEKGFAFYQDSNKTLKNVDSIKKAGIKCDCKKITEYLKKIAKENEKQTKIQEQILALLKKEIDPEPEKIVVNGKECIANSSAKCYKMPITAEAKKIPAMKKWMENPNMENTVNYLQWQSKHFQEVFKRGNSFPLAIAQFGADAYPILNQTRGYTSAFGTFDLLERGRDKAINKYKDRFKYLVFFGINDDLDIISFHRLKSIRDKYKDLDFEIIVKTQKNMQLYNDVLKALFTKEAISKYNKAKISIKPEFFKKFNIFTTPSLVVVDKKDKKAQIIINGRLTENLFAETMFNYLENRDLVDYKELSDYKIYKENQSEINEKNNYFRRLYDVDIDKLLKSESKK